MSTRLRDKETSHLSREGMTVTVTQDTTTPNPDGGGDIRDSTSTLTTFAQQESLTLADQGGSNVPGQMLKLRMAAVTTAYASYTLARGDRVTWSGKSLTVQDPGPQHHESDSTGAPVVTHYEAIIGSRSAAGR